MSKNDDTHDSERGSLTALSDTSLVSRVIMEGRTIQLGPEEYFKFPARATLMARLALLRAEVERHKVGR